MTARPARSTPQVLDRPFDRRRFLVNGLRFGAVAAVGLPFLEACGSSSSSTGAGSSTSSAASAAGSTSAAADYGTLNYRLAWIKNAEFAGSYIADSKGFYKDAGFSKVNLIAGGPTATPQEADVQTGKAIVALSSPDITAAAILKGADVKIIGAGYQKNPFAIMSNTKNPITTPQGMIGKKIGVQAVNESVWQAFLKANNVDPSKITKVPVQFDPLPLAQGQVDGWFSFITNEPIDLRSKGYDVTTFLLADFNYPLVSETYFAKSSTISDKPDLLKAFLTAEIKGWKESLADPAEGAALAANTYGKGNGLTADEQTLESKAQNALIVSDDTKTNGIFTMTEDLITKNIATLKIAGIDITPEKLFDLSLLTDVYKQNPSLI